MEDTLNSSVSVRYVQVVIRLHPTQAFTTALELRKALNGSPGVDSALVDAEEILVCFDRQRITERAIESLLRQTGRTPAGIEVLQTGPSPASMPSLDLASHSQ